VAEFLHNSALFISMNLAECYRLLGLSAGASFSEIKTSYRRLVRVYHPDVNPDNQEQAHETFIRLTEAYKTLTRSAHHSRLASSSQANGTPSSSSPSTQSCSSSYTSSRSQPSSPPPSPFFNRHQVAAPISDRSHQTASQRSTAYRSASTPAPSSNTEVANRFNTFNTRLSRIDQKLKQSSYEQLQILLRERRFPRAIALVEGLSQRIPDDPEVRQWQAITYERWGRYLIDRREFGKAKLYLKKALQTDPNNRSLWTEIEKDFHRIERLLHVSSS
jgi:curved DNA-binding protein CbpA